MEILLFAVGLTLGIMLGGGAAAFFLRANKNESEKLQEAMKLQFENAANKILEEKSRKFVSINEEKIATILNPLKEKITDFQRKVEETHSAETRENAKLLEAIKHINETNKQMADEANNLTRALKGDNKIQGDWGELQLEVLLENLGFQEGTHYRKQASFKGEADGLGDVRPDFVINLPEKKHCVIDSKVSLTSYERYFNLQDGDEKNRALKEHVASIKRHIAGLSEKKYEQINEINSPDFVFMFVPIEAALMLAVQNSPSIIEDAVKKNVMLVSTSTLLFALRTVLYIWKVDSQNKNVQEIAKVGGELYDKFAAFTEDLIKIGNQINAVQNTFGAAMGKLNKKNLDGSDNAGTILGKMETLRKMGANATKEIKHDALKNRELSDDDI